MHYCWTREPHHADNIDRDHGIEIEKYVSTIDRTGDVYGALDPAKALLVSESLAIINSDSDTL